MEGLGETGFEEPHMGFVFGIQFLVEMHPHWPDPMDGAGSSVDLFRSTHWYPIANLSLGSNPVLSAGSKRLRPQSARLPGS